MRTKRMQRKTKRTRLPSSAWQTAIERDAKGSYVPPSMRRVLEEEKRREQSDSRPMRRGPPPTKDASDFPSLMAVKKDDEPEPKEDKEKKQKKKKNRPAPPAGGAAPPSATSTGVPSASGTPIPPGVEPELWQKFASLVHSALKSGKDAKQTASEAEEMLDESALKAPAASAEVIAVVLEENDKTEASLRQTCQKAAPLLKAFLAKRDEGSSPSPSVQLIRDCVLKAFKAGMPKVTDGEGLPMVKVVFEELEKAEVVSPEACVAWFDDFEDETEGREKVLFQVMSFMEEMKKKTGDTGGPGDAGGDEEDEESEDEDDIEAVIPQRGTDKAQGFAGYAL